ncbi:MAG: C10 family peptidase [Bacteroidales bacterium]|nr:C10 family peptidase [Bacteroidales bacterium]
MKRKYLLLSLLCISLQFAACDPVEKPVDDPPLDYQYTEADMNRPLNETYFVSPEDLNAYLHYKSLVEKKEIVVESITPVKNNAGDTLLYLINYDEGWDLLAADKRATVPLGSDKTGHLNLEETEHPIVSWIMCLSEDVYATRMTDSCNSEAPDITEYNINTWKAITADESLFREVIEEYLPETRSYPHIGQYVFAGVTEVDLFYDEVRHLTTTKWCQDDHNCNDYVPWRSDDPSLHAPAGCVAVAGAQMLYYLHYYMGIPQTAPTTAYCYSSVGDPDPLSQMGQGDYSATAWAEMDSLGQDKAGMLIASVAKMVHKNFGNNGSGAITADLVTDCFPNYRIASNYASYQETTVSNSLMYQNMPVIVRAGGTAPNNNGHCFIIDGYMRTRHQTIYTYVWEWLNYDPEEEYPKMPNQYDITYSSPVISYYYMNWGWGGDCNNVAFAKSGDWVIDNQYNFIYERAMIHNFHDYFE